MTKFIFIALFAFSYAYAGCENVAQDFILRHKNIKLAREESTLLLPGMEGLAYNGRFYNRWNSTVEIFFLEEENEYSALLIHASKCQALERQQLLLN